MRIYMKETEIDIVTSTHIYFRYSIYHFLIMLVITIGIASIVLSELHVSIYKLMHGIFVSNKGGAKSLQDLIEIKYVDDTISNTFHHFADWVLYLASTSKILLVSVMLIFVLVFMATIYGVFLFAFYFALQRKYDTYSLKIVGHQKFMAVFFIILLRTTMLTGALAMQQLINREIKKGTILLDPSPKL